MTNLNTKKDVSFTIKFITKSDARKYIEIFFCFFLDSFHLEITNS